MQVLEVQDAEYGTLARMLRKIDFFSPLTVAQLDEILPHVALLCCEKGETIFKQGDPGDAFYIVYTGSVAVRIKTGFFSFRRTVKSLGPGSFFGEIALVAQEARTATVIAEEPSQLFCLVAQDFQFVLDGNPHLREQLHKMAVRRKFFQKIK